MNNGQNSGVFSDQNYKNDCFLPKNSVILAENEKNQILRSDHHAKPADLGRTFEQEKQNTLKTLFWRISAKKSTRQLRITGVIVTSAKFRRKIGTNDHAPIEY